MGSVRSRSKSCSLRRQVKGSGPSTE